MAIRQIFESKLREGQLERDPAQEQVVQLFDALCEELSSYVPARKSAALGWLFGARPESRAPRGLYLWGGVGRGKSMLMDLFFDGVEVTKKRRVHFHAFMAEVHEAIFRHRQAVKRGTAKGDDPIPPVAEAIAARATLLCFDEFTVTDIADAMILGRLFGALFGLGVVIVATSNVAPGDLYKDGLNRALFLPSIELIMEKMQVVELASRTDYRLEKLAGSQVFLVPADADARAALTETFRTLTGHRSGRPSRLTVLGRTLDIPEARGTVARFPFAALCERALGPQDYLAIARRFHSVLIDDIPVLSASQRNEAKRFITLIDTLYEGRIKLFASAAAEPAGLFEATDGREAFEFQRTVSRLNEMRSAEYLALPVGRADADTVGIVET